MMTLTRGNIEILLDTPGEQNYVVSAFADLTVKDGFRNFFDREIRNQARLAGAAISETEASKVLEANIAEIRAAVSEQVPSSARGVAAFVSVPRRLRHVIALDFPVQNRLVLDEEPFLTPLLEHWYGEPSYLVASVDSNRATIYEAWHGTLGEAETIARPDIEMDIQRDKPRFTYKKRFEQVFHEYLHGAEQDQFLKTIVEEIAEHWTRGNFQGLILIARPSIRGAMRHLLPKELAATVVESESQAAALPSDEVAAEVARVVESWHARRDSEVTHELERRRKEKHLLAEGPTDVLDALQQGRATSLIVGRSRSMAGASCRDCGYSFGAPIATCVYCNGGCRSVDALQDILRRALKQRVPVHLFRPGPDPDPVAASGGVAALLRAGANWAPGTVGASGPEK
jgi:protein required for attachment to host cells